MSETTNLQDRPVVRPSRIAKFDSLNRCPAYLAHEYSDVFSDSVIDDIPPSPLLQAIGEEHEQRQLNAVLDARVRAVGPSEHPLSDRFDEVWSDDISDNIEQIQEIVRSCSGNPERHPVVLHEAPLKMGIEAWSVEGRADLVVITPTDTSVEIRIIELKSSSKTYTHHKLQAATYTLGFRSLLETVPDHRVSASVTSEDRPLAAIVTATGDIDLEELPQFDLRPFENDVNLLLEADGPFDQAILGEAELPIHQLNTKCEGCPHQAKCLSHDISTQDLALLQLPESTQIVFQKHGISSISGIASLYEIPQDEYDRTPVNYDSLQPIDPELVETLQEATDRYDLSELAQIAHRFRRELEPTFDQRWRDKNDAGPWPTWLVGSGVNLPDDNPNDESWSSEWDEYPKRSLVRVYPTVVHDYIRERLVYIGAIVTSTRHELSGNDPEFVSAPPEALPQTESEKNEEEKRLLEVFFDKLEDAVGRVAPDISNEAPHYSENDGYLHIYCWSEQQRDSLVEAVKRHPDATGAPALRKILGLRREIDQESVSILTEDFRNRHALRYPSLGIVQTTAQFYNGDKEFSWDLDWENADYGIKEVFDEGFFRSAAPIDTFGGDRIVPNLEDGYVIPDDQFREDVYPVLQRHRDTVPLEYFWASEEFDRLKPTDVDDPDTRARINQFRHYDGPETPRISLDDIECLLKAICSAVEYVERSIYFKDAKTPKEPLKVGNLSEEQFGETALQRACVEYQQLDHGAQKESIINTYRRPLQQRVIDGDAIVFECSRTPADNEVTIRGDVIRDVGERTGSPSAAPLSISIGDWVVITPLESESSVLTEVPEKPEYYANSTLAVVERVNKDTISLFSIWDEGDWPRGNDPNMTWHYGWTADEEAAAQADHFISQRGRDYDKTLIQRGRKFVVDRAIDDYTAYRARKALQNASENVVHNRLESAYEDEDAAALRQSICPANRVEEFIELFNSAMPDTLTERQAAFVKQVDHSITALQGPPGTGKTSMAATPAILSRAYAHGEGFNGLCSAHSNTAVDELVDDLSEALRRLQNDGYLSDVSIIRVRSSKTYHDTPANVVDLHYRDDWDELQTLFNETMNSESRVIVCATPVTIRNALNKIVQAESDSDYTVKDLMADGRSQLFHGALVDEASMMDLPVLFLVGAFLREEGQLMLVGDHRQMQPIQAHDWEQEDRQPVEEHTPALSVLNFLRFIRGDVGADLEYLERDAPEWPDPDAVLPMEQLNITYRLPQSVADLETKLFYSQDEITLDSGLENPPTIPDVRDTIDEEWLQAALDPDPRITLLVHDENQARQESPFEGELTRQIVDALPTAAPHERQPTRSVSAGVVVPFRRQRRYLRRELANHVQVDTVEKFQGGERDFIILSMTAGNQGYINTLSEFLLDPNRFNVGASRMRQKLIIIASKSLFRAGSADAKEYADQKSWKLLYDELARDCDPEAELVATGQQYPGLDERQVKVDVYPGFEDEGNN